MMQEAVTYIYAWVCVYIELQYQFRKYNCYKFFSQT